ncbi:MAG: hypothetical protein KME64_34040 [Scytonematopsis contorta HA4267-MV1]|nr:hypothetical protein [Scytonematopsis contorta HA4267-MV1]
MQISNNLQQLRYCSVKDFLWRFLVCRDAINLVSTRFLGYRIFLTDKYCQQLSKLTQNYIPKGVDSL